MILVHRLNCIVYWIHYFSSDGKETSDITLEPYKAISTDPIVEEKI